MSRLSRRRYPKHSGDAFDRFLTERSKGADGEFSWPAFLALVEAIEYPTDLIPRDGNNGTKRMTVGILLRSFFADGRIHFKDGSTIQLDLEES